MNTRQFPEAYQLKITLTDSEPEVWRRVQVSGQITLTELHDIVQRVMGWENQHGHDFRHGIGSSPCSPQQSLTEIFGAGEGPPLYYTYDFQSGWLHRIEVERVAEANILASAMPCCLAGEAACPPENSGGVWGYDDFLVRLEDSSDPDYMDLIEKYGDFDPDRFDLAAANRRLAL
jgi:hypothetical protein